MKKTKRRFSFFLSVVYLLTATPHYTVKAQDHTSTAEKCDEILITNLRGDRATSLNDRAKIKIGELGAISFGALAFFGRNVLISSLSSTEEKKPSIEEWFNNIDKLEKYGDLSKAINEAEKLEQEILQIDKESTNRLAKIQHKLGVLYHKRKEYPKAESYYEKSLITLKEYYKNSFGEGFTNPDEAAIYNSLVQLYLELANNNDSNSPKDLEKAQENLDKAEENLKKAEDVLDYVKTNFPDSLPLGFEEKLYNQQRENYANLINTLAAIYSRQGNYQKAANLYQDSLSRLQQNSGDNPLAIATVSNNLARVYLKLEKYEEAEKLYRDALEKIKNVYPDNDDSNSAIILLNWGELYIAQNQDEKAIDYFEQAMDIQNDILIKNLMEGTESEKLNYKNTITEPTDIVISGHLQSMPNNAKANRLAVETLLRRKGLVLDFTEKTHKLIYERLERLENPEDRQQYKNYFEELKTTKQQIANLYHKSRKIGQLNNEEEEKLKGLKQSEKDLYQKLSKTDNSSCLGVDESVTLEKIQEKIPRDAVLVEYYKYTPHFSQSSQTQTIAKPKPRYAAYIIYPKGEPIGIDLGESEEIEKQVKKFQSQIQRQPKGSDSDIDSSVKKQGQTLEPLIMKPIRDKIGTRKRIIISPDALLNVIPFEALVDQVNNQYLVENYDISYVNAGRDLIRINGKQPEPNSNQVLLVGRPHYKYPTQEVLKEKNCSESQIATNRNRSSDGNGYKDLVGTECEIKAISTLKMFSGAEILLREEATETAIKKTSSPKILVIATHGQFYDSSDTRLKEEFSNSLLSSFLVLTGADVNDKPIEQDDGILTADEIAFMDLRGTKLVVLSACETGLGEDQNGEGILGLRRSLVIAGSETQLVSLWRVNDGGTKDLMVEYFKGLEDGKGRVKSLKDIQLSWIRGEQNGKYQHPHYWASFITLGDWNPLQK